MADTDSNESDPSATELQRKLALLIRRCDSQRHKPDLTRHHTEPAREQPDIRSLLRPTNTRESDELSLTEFCARVVVEESGDEDEGQIMSWERPAYPFSKHDPPSPGLEDSIISCQSPFWLKIAPQLQAKHHIKEISPGGLVKGSEGLRLSENRFVFI